jgi:argininosuccinate lyase
VPNRLSTDEAPVLQDSSAYRLLPTAYCPYNPPMSTDKSWQARISEATDEIAQKFVESISYDRRLYRHDIAGSIAHATMLANVGLITDAERDAIVEGLKGIERDIEAGNFEFDESLEDIHMVIEAALIQRIGEPGRKLHTGRSRNDQVALDLKLWVEEHRGKLLDAAYLLSKAFVLSAERHRDVVMPSYTHLQRAQPICAGAELLAWASFIEAAADRYNFSEPDVTNRMPLGSGAIAGSSLPLNPELTWSALNAEMRPDGEREANYTGFSGVAINSIYETASRDAACEFVFNCAMIAMHLSRWAEQWIIYMTTEFGFIRIADRYTTGSSMMPQKRNPDMLELIRGRCGNVYGDLFALMTILKGLPIGYNRDLQEDKRIVFRAYDTVSSCLTMAAAIVNSAEFVKESIEPTLERGFLDATSLAEYLVTKGVAFRTAHQIVGSLVAKCEKEGKHALKQLTVDDFNQAIADATTATSRDREGAGRAQPVQVDEDVYTCLGAHNVVKRYQSAGAAGGKPFEEQLKAWKQRLGM